MARGACLRTDPEAFFPDGSGRRSAEQAQAAKLVCRDCAVREQCLAWALNMPESDGVWGGTTPDERRALRADIAGNPSASVARNVRHVA